jgi:hypothetical protein
MDTNDRYSLRCCQLRPWRVLAGADDATAQSLDRELNPGPPGRTPRAGNKAAESNSEDKLH